MISTLMGPGAVDVSDWPGIGQWKTWRPPQSDSDRRYSSVKYCTKSPCSEPDMKDVQQQLPRSQCPSLEISKPPVMVSEQTVHFLIGKIERFPGYFPMNSSPRPPLCLCYCVSVGSSVPQGAGTDPGLAQLKSGALGASDSGPLAGPEGLGGWYRGEG